MQARKVLVKEGDVANITCPICLKTKQLSVARYKEIRKRELRIKCSCDNLFCLCLEYRKHPRKSVRLLGHSTNLSKHRERQDIIIKNISLGGIGFSTFNEHRTQKDDQMHVSFELDDCNNSQINSEAIVRSMSKDHVGCEFNTTEKFKTPLGFYLLI
jgi:hypothetical protein